MANWAIYNTTDQLATVAQQYASTDPYLQLSLTDRINSVLVAYSDVNKYVSQDYSAGGRLIYGLLLNGEYRITLDNYELTYTGTFSGSFSRVSEMSVRYIPDGSTMVLKGNVTYNGAPFFSTLNLSSTVTSVRAGTLDFNVGLTMQATFTSTGDLVGSIESIDSALFSDDFQTGKTSSFYSDVLAGNLQFQLAGLYSDSTNSRIVGGYLDYISMGLYDSQKSAFTDSVVVTNAQISLIRPSGEGFDTSTNDVITLTGQLGSIVDAGAGNDIATGSSGHDSIAGGYGNDRIEGKGGNDHVDGGVGIDTALFSGVPSQYTIERNDSTRVTLRGVDGVDELVNVERLKIGSYQIAIDIEGNAGMAYRLYKAAFDRVPDLGGLGYQMNDLDIGVSLQQVASNFIASPEFQSTYGNVDNTQFVTLLYHNVLDRDPEAAGLMYHTDRLALGATRADILIGFSESPENQANVIGAIQYGMSYIW